MALTGALKSGMKKPKSKISQNEVKMKVRYDAYCGLNCGACPIGLANEQEDEQGLQKMAEEWGVKREDLNCTGCKTTATASFCTKCDMRLCALETGVEFCNQCDEFPCEIITAFRNDKAPHHSAIFENLEEIKNKGIEVWLESEKKKWSCGKCGTRFTWYNETCSECGEELFNAVNQEKELKT